MDMPYTVEQRELIKEIFGPAGLFKIEKDFGIEWDPRLCPPGIKDEKPPKPATPEPHEKPENPGNPPACWVEVMPDPLEIDEPLSIEGLGPLFDVSTRTLENWKSTGFLPKPDEKIGRLHAWAPETIQRFDYFFSAGCLDKSETFRAWKRAGKPTFEKDGKTWPLIQKSYDEGPEA